MHATMPVKTKKVTITLPGLRRGGSSEAIALIVAAASISTDAPIVCGLARRNVRHR